jgi:hypothetical protein
MTARATAIAIRPSMPAEALGQWVDDVHLDLAAGAVILARAIMRERQWLRCFMPLCGAVAARELGPSRFSMELPMGDASDEVPTADAVRFGYTDDGQLVLELLKAGEIIAAAWMTPEKLGELIGQGCDLIEIVSRGGVATVKCMGTA